MPREKWLIDPGELDDFQKKIYQLNIDDSYIVSGGAGSCKTILALYRARDIYIRAVAEGNPVDFTFVVFTKALRSFIRSGIEELGIDINQVIHYTNWDGSEIDYVIVDECQDFKKDEIETLYNAKIKSIMLYGDSEQQVYKERMSVEDISKEFSIIRKDLVHNYRLPKLIADFAAYVGNDKNLRDKCVRNGSEKPRIKRLASWQEELDYIMGEIRTRNYTDVAILLPFNNKTRAQKTNQGFRNVESVKEYFDANSFTCEAKIRENEGFDHNDLDFDSELPKIMTFHSCKGLQFETVFIPFCDYPIHDKWLINYYTNPLYVGLTRTYKNLYITHTERLTLFFEKIPPTKYE